MPRFLYWLPVLVWTAGLLALVPGTTLAQGSRDPLTETQNVANQMAKSLRILREDIDVELPDNRGEALGAQVDNCVLHVRQLQRAVRGGAAKAQLHKIVVELDKDLDRLVAAAAALGADAYYFRPSAVKINAQNEYLARLLAPPTIPPRFFALTDQIAKSLQALHDDIDIDLPDARGKALIALSDRCQAHAVQIYRGGRFGAPPARLRQHLAELNRDLQQLVEAAGAIGSDAYYLRKSAANIRAQGEEALKVLGSS